MWLGEQITDKGIGNGISLMIFAGIVSRLPSMVHTVYATFIVNINFAKFGELLLLAVAVFAMLAFVVFMLINKLEALLFCHTEQVNLLKF